MADEDYGPAHDDGAGYADGQSPASPYAAKNAKAAPKPNPSGKAPGANGEVTLLARFVWQPEIDGATEVKYLLAGQWHPTYADYVEITGVTVQTSAADIYAFLGAIVEYQPGSIKRLNFFTHSDRSTIGLTGYVDPSGVYFTSYIDGNTIAQQAAPGVSFTVGKRTFTLDDVRARFAEDAVFVLYGCDAAWDPTTMLTAFRDVLQVSVVGFKRKNVYCPPTQTVGSKTFNRQGEKIGVQATGFTCGKDSTRDWRSLISDPNAVRVAK